MGPRRDQRRQNQRFLNILREGAVLNWITKGAIVRMAAMTETVIIMNGLTKRFEYRSSSPERVMIIIVRLGTPRTEDKELYKYRYRKIDYHVANRFRRFIYIRSRGFGGVLGVHGLCFGDGYCNRVILSDSTGSEGRVIGANKMQGTPRVRRRTQTQQNLNPRQTNASSS